MSDREIERRYSKLQIRVAEPNRTNCYVCGSCGHVTKTIDIHHGTTPMFMTCDKCHGQQTSSFYRDVYPELMPEYEWFMPTLDEVKKYRRNPAMLDHIFAGGLDFRKIKK